MSIRHAAAVWLLALAAGPLSAAPPATPEEEVAALLATLNADLTAGDVRSAAGLLDLPRLWEEARAALGLRCDPAGRGRAVERLEMRLARPAESLPAALGSPAPRWALARVESAAGDTEYVAVTHEWEEDGLCRAVRWRILRRDDGLRVFDREDLDTGSRLSLLLALRCAGFLVDLGLPDAAAVVRVAEAAEAVRRLDLGEAEEMLIPADPDAAMPPAVEAWRRTLLAEVSLWAERLRPALRHAGAAADLAPGSPAALYVRSRARLATGDHAGALADARAAGEAMAGGNAEVFRVEARALLSAGKPAEALAAVRAGLSLEPGNPWLLALLAEGAPDGAEFAERLAVVADPFGACGEILRLLLDADQRAAAATAVTKYRLLRPEDPRASVFVARLLCAGNRHEAAGRLLLATLPRVPEEERDSLREGFAEEMLAAGKAVEAYEALPDKSAAFELLTRLTGDDLAIAALVEAHRPRTGADPLFLYLDGLAHAGRGEWADAERIWAQVEEVGETPRLSADVFRRLRAQNLLDAGEWRLAYEKAGPRRWAFRYVADSLAANLEVEMLNDLIALHEADDPEDPLIALYRARLLAMNGRHADAADLLAAHRSRIEADPDGAWRVRDVLVRSLLRLGRFDAALAEARSAPDVVDAAALTAWVHAAAGRPEDLRRALETLEDLDFAPSEFYLDEFLGPALRSEAFAALRAEFPE